MTIGGERQASCPWLCRGWLSRVCAQSHNTRVVGEGVDGTSGRRIGERPKETGVEGKGCPVKGKAGSTRGEGGRDHGIK